MALVKITFRSINDIDSFLRQNSVTQYTMHAAERYMILQDKQYIIPAGSTIMQLTGKEPEVTTFNLS